MSLKSAAFVAIVWTMLIGWAIRSRDQASQDPYDQSAIPLEVQPTDPALAKIVLVAGGRSHGPGEHEFFAGCALLMKLLQQTSGVFPVMARDGWPKNPHTFDNARSVVFFMDGGSSHPILRNPHTDVIQKLIDQGVGFVNLHYAVEYPKRHQEAVFSWLGGYYETGFSTNPHWKANFQTIGTHAVTRGVHPFPIEDEWYFNIRFRPEMKGITPVLKAVPPDHLRRTEAAKNFPGRQEIVAWTYERPNGGRSFGFTGGHFHRNWANEDFRRLVINAILWTAKVQVPENGAKVDLDPADLNKNLDRKVG